MSERGAIGRAGITAEVAAVEAGRMGITVVEAGRVPYERALLVQRRLAAAKIEGKLSRDFLLLLEHEPVITVGRGARTSAMPAAPGLLAARGIRRVEIERGGDVTYHGPGQLVGYPILDLTRFRRDLHWYLRRLEESLIRALGALGLPAFRVAGYSGVWVGERAGEPVRRDLSSEEAAPLVPTGKVRKIASLGVHVSRWVTWHGFALNVTREPLENFRLIVPCGIPGVHMTSIEAELGPKWDSGAGRLLPAVIDSFGQAFGVRMEPLKGERPEELAELTELTELYSHAGALEDVGGEREF